MDSSCIPEYFSFHASPSPTSMMSTSSPIFGDGGRAAGPVRPAVSELGRSLSSSSTSSQSSTVRRAASLKRKESALLRGEENNKAKLCSTTAAAATESQTLSAEQPVRGGGSSVNTPPQFKITVTPPTNPIAYAELQKRMNTLPHQLNLIHQKQMLNCETLGVTAISTVEEFEKLLVEESTEKYEVVVVDLRPFNQYNISRVKGALSICVPTTLLKRNSFHMSNIFKTMVKSQEEYLERVLEDEHTNIKFIFYDSSSNKKHCMPHMYQIMKKFQEIGKDYPNKNIGLYMLNKGLCLLDGHEELMDTSKFKKPESHEDSSLSAFATFLLPSADPASSFVMSLKKNTCFPDTRGTKLEIPKFENINQFPKWLQPYIRKDGINAIIKNFMNIESLEDARISAIAQRRSSTSSGSPGVQLQGSEYGFKNRYPNILPYEHSRVKLVPSPLSTTTTPNNLFHQPVFFRTPSTSSLSPTSAISASKFGDDYFNANFLSVPQINDAVNYIATQAPLPSTIKDFWKVVWHNKTEVIVSLTSLAENGMKKSDVYWQNSKRIELVSEEDNYMGFKALTLRRIKLTNHGDSRMISQLHFTAWPDFGAVNFKDLLTLTEIKDKVVQDTSAPIVVHCSAGCGRTGVFITVDLIISAFKRYANEGHDPHRLDVWNSDEDIINFCVQQLRKQRISMVQTVDQFVLCYQAMLQYCVDTPRPESANRRNPSDQIPLND